MLFWEFLLLILKKIFFFSSGVLLMRRIFQTGIEWWYGKKVQRLLECSDLPYPISTQGLDFKVIYSEYTIHVIFTPKKNLKRWALYFNKMDHSFDPDIQTILKKTAEFFKDTTIDVVVSYTI